jgi:outer membrane lipoprotein-sorting protein
MRTVLAVVLLPLLWSCTPAPSAAQNPDTLLPEESEKKARALIGPMIEALGGQAYLHVRESVCEGRLAHFDHNGQLTGYTVFKDYWRYPDKNRTEYSKKGNIIDLYNGDGGWTLDRGGVAEEPASAVSDFQEQVKKDLDNLLRLRLKEAGMVFRYGGSGTVDLRQADWVEIVDAERRTFRIAIDRTTHLPIRSTVITRDDATRERSEEVTIYSLYHAIDGVQIPKQVARDRDARRIFQVFYSECRLNPGLPDEMFTRASLDKHWAETAKKNKKK